MTRKVMLVSAALLACLLLGVEASAQVSLTVTKSGSNVVLTWTGGVGPFTAIKSTEGSFAGNVTTLATNATSPVTDTGAITDGKPREFYAVIDESANLLTITTPQAGFTSNAPCVSASGTASGGVVNVYVNGVLATLSSGAWSAPIAPISGAGAPGTTKPVTVTVTAFDSTYRLLAKVTVSGYIRLPKAAVRQRCAPRTAGK